MSEQISPVLRYLDAVLRGEQALEDLAARAPRAHQDQADAAARAAREHLVRLALSVPNSAGGVFKYAHLPEWLRFRMLAVIVAYVEATGRTCRHAPCGARPAAIFACAWEPGAYTCLECNRELMPGAGTEADHTCDVCGKVCTPGDEASGVQILVHSLGPLTFAFGHCRDCKADLFGSIDTFQRAAAAGGRI